MERERGVLSKYSGKAWLPTFVFSLFGAGLFDEVILKWLY
jgi:hypothetical protein